MANTTALKRRIGSVKNTRQITKAMELVAASKMRRAQEHALRTREYYKLARAILTRIRELTKVNDHPLYNQRPIKSRVHIFITSDRGLAGAYNSNVFKQLTNELRKDLAEGVESKVIAIGNKGSQFASRLDGVDIMAVYTHFPEQPTANDIRPILQTIMEKFVEGEVDAVDIIFTDYVSSINQVVRTRRLLPAAFQEVENEDLEHFEEAEFEPSVKAVLDSVTERLIEAQLSQAFLESQASEQSMRMVAMKNATDNANDLVDDLTLAFNTARQAAITQELAEITGGAEAIK